MTREEYQKECLESFIRKEYDSMVWGDNFFTDHVRKMFNAGIQCADTMPKPGLVDLSQLWHDASEKPKIGKQLIGEDTNGLFGLYAWDRLASSWSIVVEIFALRRWAYIEELLPKGGEP